MARETRLATDNLIAPLFVTEGIGVRQEIASMPDQFRFSVDVLVEEVATLHKLGIPAVALFPKIADALKDPLASEGRNPEGLYPRAIQTIKKHVPEMMVITDVALDPFSSDGHDGLVMNGQVLNDETLDVMTQMAVVQATAGADIIAPSDMMDGRVGTIRAALDAHGYTDVAILSYAAKYASAFYGPFRDALDSAPRQRDDIPADKQTYQMQPANVREALREVTLDLDEGADMVMVKPAVAYLDVIFRVKALCDVPVAAYHVSGEYAMLKAAAQQGWLDERAAATETLTAIRRAGADLILTYFAKPMAQWLREE